MQKLEKYKSCSWEKVLNNYSQNLLLRITKVVAAAPM